MKTQCKIRLRAVEPEDIELLYLWENDQTVWQVSNTLVPFSRRQLKSYIESDPSDIYAHRQMRMMIDCLEAETRARTVGSIDLFDYDPLHQRAGIALLIASPVDRRQGYGKEAVLEIIDYSRKTLFLHQLYCNIAESNIASIKLFEKIGFQIDGTKKDWLRVESGWEDVLFLQMLLA
jgi:diamine N-acetyltransferase